MRTCGASRALLCLLAVVIPLQGPGCAWLFHKNQNVEVICTVQGALIKINDQPVGPGTHLLEVGEDHRVLAEAPGYKPRAEIIKGKADFAIRYLVFDLLWVLAYGAGIVFLIVDLVTGSIWDLEPRRVELVLERDPAWDLARRQQQDPGRDRLVGPQPGPRGAPQQPPPRQDPAPVTKPPPGPVTKPPPGPVTKPPPAPPPPPAAVQPDRPAARPSGAPTPPARPSGAPTPPTPPVFDPPPASSEPPLAEPLGRTVVLAVGPGEPGQGAAALCALGQGRDARRLMGRGATRREVLRAVREHLERGVGKDDRALLYFAGPVVRGADGDLYLVAADTDPARPEETGIPAATLSAYLERVEGSMLVVVVDAAGPVEVDEVATLLAEGGALAAVAPGEAASAFARGLAPGAADQDRDARVSGDELSRWLSRELGGARGVVRGASAGAGALPVLR